MQYLLYPIFIYGLLVGISYLITFLQLCKVTLQYPIYKVEAVENIPDYLQRLFIVPIQELKELGFELCCYLRVKPILKIYPDITWEILLYNEGFNSYAKVGIRYPLEPLHLFDIEFYTFFTDKTFLLTTNGKADKFIGQIPDFILQDYYTHKTLLQWRFHHGRLRQLRVRKKPGFLWHSDFIKALGIYHNNYINSLIKRKNILPTSDKNLFRLNVNLAIKLTHKIIQENHKSREILKQRREQAQKNSKINVKIPVELKVEGFIQNKKLQRGLIGDKIRIWLILGSFALFVVTSTKYFGNQTLIIFILALILHKTGHLLVMKLSGY